MAIWRRPSTSSGVRREGRITKGGVLFVIGALAIGFAAVNTGNNLAYLFFSMMMSFLVISSLIARMSTWGVAVERVVPRQVGVGQPLEVSIILSNRKRRASSYSLRAIDCYDDGTQAGAGYCIRVPANGRREVAYTTRIEQRGVRRFGTVRVVSAFPFGFFLRSVDLPAISELLVCPRVLLAPAWIAYSPVTLGERETGRRGPGAEFHSLRDYQPGDSARLIHWKVSARTNRIVAQEFEIEETKRVTLLLDNGVPCIADSGLVDRFERAVVAAASMASAYIAQDYELRLVTRSGQVPVSVGPNHLQRVLRSLALVNLVEHSGPPLWIPPPSGDEAHIIIHYTPEAPRAVPSAIHVLDIEKTPPFAEFDLTTGNVPQRERKESNAT